MTARSDRIYNSVQANRSWSWSFQQHAIERRKDRMFDELASGVIAAISGGIAAQTHESRIQDPIERPLTWDEFCTWPLEQAHPRYSK